MIFQHWGATEEEIHGPVIGDDLCSEATLSATRSISIAAPPHVVFPWIRQMGLGRAGWYSYDWIDNFGRKSAFSIHEEWQDINSGDLIPAGPISFVAALVSPPDSFVLEIKNGKNAIPRLHFTLAYELRQAPKGTRLVTRMRSRINIPGGRLIEHLALGPGDGIMLRRQLMTLASNIERSNAKSSG